MAKKASPWLKKWGGLIGGIVATLAALGSYTLFIWTMAQNAQEAAYNAKLAEAAEQYKEDVDEAVTQALATQQADFADRLASAREAQETVIEIREVIRYVDRIKTVPAECAPIARDVVRVLQQSTDIVRKAGRTDAD